MTLLRLNPRPRKSEAVTAGETVCLAGQIPHSLTAYITVQTGGDRRGVGPAGRQ
jgi:hypothetical protein